MNNIINIAATGALEEAEILARGRRRRYEGINPLVDLSGSEFVKIYRLTKPLFNEASGLTVSKKVCTGGSYQLDIGKHLNHAISQASVSKSIQEVTDASNRPEILNAHVYLPRNIEELRFVQNGFYQHHQFPGVIGCLDCTHVAIYPPKTNDPLYSEAVYVNRKGYH